MPDTCGGMFAKRTTNSSSQRCSASHHSHQEVECLSLPLESGVGLLGCRGGSPAAAPAQALRGWELSRCSLGVLSRLVKAFGQPPAEGQTSEEALGVVQHCLNCPAHVTGGELHHGALPALQNREQIDSRCLGWSVCSN